MAQLNHWLVCFPVVSVDGCLATEQHGMGLQWNIYTRFILALARSFKGFLRSVCRVHYSWLCENFVFVGHLSTGIYPHKYVCCTVLYMNVNAEYGYPIMRKWIFTLWTPVRDGKRAGFSISFDSRHFICAREPGIEPWCVLPLRSYYVPSVCVSLSVYKQAVNSIPVRLGVCWTW